MSARRALLLCCLTCVLHSYSAVAVLGQSTDGLITSAQSKPAEYEPQANSQTLPRQILKTGINLSSTAISPNSLQLAENIELLPILKKIEDLKTRTEAIDANQSPSLETLLLKQELLESTDKAERIIQRTNLAVDFTFAQLLAEEHLYSELLSSLTSDRDRAVAKTNAVSFGTNGILWAVCEGLSIPTYRVPRYSISSGINGILAGIVPSIASFYAMRQVVGKRRTAEEEPNMLAKVFDYPTTLENDYPKAVWDFLIEVPADDKSGKTRKEQLIDRWIADRNIGAFTDRTSKRQLDTITAAVTRQKALSIETLSVRQLMLQQLGAEVLKMKRMLYELLLVVDGEKRI